MAFKDQHPIAFWTIIGLTIAIVLASVVGLIIWKVTKQSTTPSGGDPPTPSVPSHVRVGQIVKIQSIANDLLFVSELPGGAAVLGLAASKNDASEFTITHFVESVFGAHIFEVKIQDANGRFVNVDFVTGQVTLKSGGTSPTMFWTLSTADTPPFIPNSPPLAFGAQEQFLWVTDLGAFNGISVDSTMKLVPSTGFTGIFYLQFERAGQLPSVTCETRRQDAADRIAARQAKYADSPALFETGSPDNPDRGPWNTTFLPPGPNNDYPEFRKLLEDGVEGATIFIGDSITQSYMFDVGGLSAWAEYQQAGMKPVNFGISGDIIENMLFRYNMYSGHVTFTDAVTQQPYTLRLMQALKPRLFVLMMGTNNYGIDNDKMSEATLNFADLIHQDFPCASVMVLAIPPNNISPARLNDLRATNDFSKSGIAQINSLEPPCLGSVDFHDVWDPFFVNGDSSSSSGVLDTSLFIDGLHPNTDGYNVWLHEGGLLAKLVGAYTQCPPPP